VQIVNSIFGTEIMNQTTFGAVKVDWLFNGPSAQTGQFVLSAGKGSVGYGWPTVATRYNA